MLALIKLTGWLGLKPGISTLKYLQHQHSSHLTMLSICLRILQWNHGNRSGNMKQQVNLLDSSYHKLVRRSCFRTVVWLKSHSRMLLNDTMLHDDSYRTGTSDTPVCECASERETVEHFLIRCPCYKKFRSDLISTVQEIGTSPKSKSHLYLIFIH